MMPIIHRINTIAGLEKIPRKYGVEIDVRTWDGRLILNHEPFQGGERLDEYLTHFKHAFIIIDVKEEGIEKQVITLCKKHGISNFFLLGVSFPFIYMLSKNGFGNLALRLSEFEALESFKPFKGKIEWVWVDTFTSFPLDNRLYKEIKDAGFRICLVSPERWGRPEDIRKCLAQMKKGRITVDAVMTSLGHVEEWVVEWRGNG